MRKYEIEKIDLVEGPLVYTVYELEDRGDNITIREEIGDYDTEGQALVAIEKRMEVVKDAASKL